MSNHFYSRNHDTWLSYSAYSSCKKDGEFWKRHIFFRNILQSNQNLRSEYSQLKQELAQREWKTRNDYAAANADFIKQVEDQYYK